MYQLSQQLFAFVCCLSHVICLLKKTVDSYKLQTELDTSPKHLTCFTLKKQLLWSSENSHVEICISFPVAKKILPDIDKFLRLS